MTKKYIDLTKRLNASLTIYKDDDYEDPPFETKPWAKIDQQGYNVDQILLGTQTGTHIDAPLHFHKEGVSIEAIEPNDLIGDYYLIDFDSPNFNELSSLVNYKKQKIIFLKSIDNVFIISSEFLESLISIRSKLWILAGDVEIQNKPPFYFNQEIAKAGIFLVEDLDKEACKNLPLKGKIIALPLNLEGVSGAPCRIILHTQHLSR